MDSSTARKISTDSAERLWFVARGSVLKGPFTTDQLKDKVARREISFMDFCWRQGFNEWRPIGAVEDFDRRSRLKRLPLYPTVEVPAAATGGIYLRDTSPPEEERASPIGKGASFRRVKNVTPSAAAASPSKFEVSFARHRRHSISIYEYGLAAIFAVVLAYFAADTALTQVSQSVLRRMAYYSSGIEQVRGVENEEGLSVHPDVWQPLYSAPSLGDLASVPTEERLNLPEAVTLDVELSGLAKSVQNSETSYQMGDYTVNFKTSPDFWDSRAEGIDPVYVRPVRVRGRLMLDKPNQIKVFQNGEPYIQ